MSNHALVVQAGGGARVEEIPMPKLRDDYIIVKVHAVALNPTDWKHADMIADAGAILGCDYAGVVVEVGPKVTNGLKKGQRVSGATHGGNVSNHNDGCFGEYIVAKGDLQIEIPENLSFEEASTLGVGVTTCGLALYQSLKFPLPGTGTSPNTPVLIYSGSSATGSLAIQYAKLTGLTVITTCSPHNFEYVKSLGADVVYDYNSPTCAKDIKEYTKDNLQHVLDCISTSSSAAICVAAMSSSSGGIYSTLLRVPDEEIHKINPKVTGIMTLAYTAFGEDFKKFGFEFKANEVNHKYASHFWQISKGLLAEGKIKVHRPTVNAGGKGLEGILAGFQMMREGKVSGEKLVYTLE